MFYWLEGELEAVHVPDQDMFHHSFRVIVPEACLFTGKYFLHMVIHKNQSQSHRHYLSAQMFAIL